MTTIKTPPHSLEAETAVLGGLMLDNSQLDHVAEILRKDYFYSKNNQLVYEAICELADKSEPFDVITVSEYLTHSGKLQQANAVVGTMALETPSATNTKYYAEQVREKAYLRSIIAAGNELTRDAYEPNGKQSSDILDAAQVKLSEVAERAEGTATNMKTLMKRFIETLDRRACGEEIVGEATGFYGFDHYAQGFTPGQLIVIAARPAMGKTTLATNIAANFAKRGKRVAFFSLEMSEDEISMRLVSAVGKVPLQNIRSGKLANQEEWDRVMKAQKKIAEMDFLIDDGSSLTPLELRSRSRKYHRSKPLDLIVVDYIQRMKSKGENRTQEIGDISRSLKSLAKELKVPVIALSQLNRGVEQRANKRPIPSDLRESGDIEQDADIIAFIYRDEVYDEDSVDKGCAELILGKNRNGPIGMAPMVFVGDQVFFDNLAGKLPSQMGVGKQKKQRYEEDI